MPVTPEGPLSLSLVNLQILVAACPSFQTWTGSADAAEALTRVHLVDIPAPDAGRSEYTVEQLQAMRPLARVNLFETPNGVGGQAWQSDRVAESAYSFSCRLVLDFLDNVGEDMVNDTPGAKLSFMNNVGAVIMDMLGLSGTNGYLVIDRIEIFQSIARSDQTLAAAQGDFYRTQLLLQCG